MDENFNKNDANRVTPKRSAPVASTGRKKSDGQIPQTHKEESTFDMFESAYKQQRRINEQNMPQNGAYSPNVGTPDAKAPIVAARDDGDKKNDKFKILFIFLIILIIVIAVASTTYLVLFSSRGDNVGNGSVSDSKSQTQLHSLELTSPFEYEQTYDVTFPDGILEKFKPLYAQNQDFAGWLTVPGTSIDTPVYATDNNSYYLKHDNYGTYTKYGVPFLDMYDDPSSLSRNTVIYGHNFDNDLIFDEIHNYEDVEFYKRYPVISYSNLTGDYKWKVIAAFRTNGSDDGDNGYLFYYIATEMGDNNFMEFYDELMQRSYIDTGVDVQASDKILTLSTCTYFFDKNGSLENARFVLVARLVRDGESESVETDNAVQRDEDDIRYPQLYYDVFGGTNPYKNASKWVPSSN